MNLISRLFPKKSRSTVIETNQKKHVVLFLNENKYKIHSKVDLKKYLNHIPSGYSNINMSWLSGEEHISSFTVLIHGTKAFAMILPENNPVGFSSRNNEKKDSEATVDFILDNGQCDEYPEWWVISKTSALNALEYYYEHGEKSPDVEWFDDSKDNA